MCAFSAARVRVRVQVRVRLRLGIEHKVLDHRGHALTLHPADVLWHQCRPKARLLAAEVLGVPAVSSDAGDLPQRRGADA